MSQMVRNILYVDSYFSIGGGQKSMMAIVANVDRMRYFPIVAIPRGAPLRKMTHQIGAKTIEVDLGNSLIETEDVKNDIFKTLVGFLQLLRAWVSFYRICLEQRISLIHTNSIKATFVTGPASMLLHIPVVWHVRHATNHRILDRVAASFCRRIVTVSDYVARELSRFTHGQNNKIVRIHNGIEVPSGTSERDTIDVRAQFHLPGSNHLIGIVGRLLSWKGHETFLKAIPSIVTESQNTSFLIVGDIPFSAHSEYKRRLATLCEKLGITDRVVFTGFMENVSSVISALTVLVNASENEPLSRVVLEALSLGVPTVATDSGGSPEIITNRETGMLVPVNNPQALADAILEILRNPAMAGRISRNGKDLVARHFNVGTYVRNVEDLYENTLCRRYEMSGKR